MREDEENGEYVVEVSDATSGTIASLIDELTSTYPDCEVVVNRNN